MILPSYSSDLRANRHQTLQQHSAAVAALAQELAPQYKELAYTAGYFHDWGKSLPEWQNAVKRGTKPPWHAPQSSQHFWEQYTDTDISIEDILIIAYTIYKHHGSLENVSGILKYLDFPEHKAKLIKTLIRSDNPQERYYKLREVFSALTMADKLVSARRHYTALLRTEKLFPLLTTFLESFGPPENTINTLRSDARQEVAHAPAQKLNLLSLPTGMGKTETGILKALQIAEEHNLDKIIVALPFITLIEQTQERYKKIFNRTVFVDNYKVDTKNWRDRYWNHDIIITTFVQLWDIMFARNKWACSKFLALQNSVILLDEIQSIPVKYQKVIEGIFKELAERYNIHFIIMSATIPALDIPQLINPAKYYSGVNRTVLTKYDVKTITDLVTCVENDARDRSTLAIVNTIKKAKDVYQGVKHPNKYLLHTGIIPKYRSAIIAEVKKKLDEAEPVLLVSTQLIEAGVDISFPIVWRDFAPLPSIIQSMGRCNRGWEAEGDVKVCSWSPEAKYVYEELELRITSEVLADATYKERDLLELIIAYYKKINEGAALSMEEYEKDRLACYTKGDIQKLSNSFQLIHEQQGKSTYFVLAGGEAKKLYTKYITTLEDGVGSIEPSMYDYMVTLKGKHEGIRALSLEEYDIEMGEIREPSTV